MTFGEASVTGDDLTTHADNTFPAGGNRDCLFMNGQNRSQKEMESGKWVRLHMIQISFSTPARVEMSYNVVCCEWLFLLATDGSYM